MVIKSLISRKLYKQNHFLGFCFTLLYRQKNLLWVNRVYIAKAVCFYIKLKRQERLQSYIFTYTNVCLFFLRKSIFKVPLSDVAQKDLETNYNNYLALRVSPIKEYVVYSCRAFKNGYVMEKLYQRRLSYTDVKAIVSDIQQCSKSNQPMKIKSLIDQLSSDFDILKHDVFKNIFHSWNKAAMHGDLTPLNIMQNKKGEIALIDLDRFTLNGYAPFDLYHYKIESEAKQKNVRFFEIIQSKIIDNNYNKKDLLYYLLIRLSLEKRENVKPSSNYVRSVNRLLNSFKMALSA